MKSKVIEHPIRVGDKYHQSDGSVTVEIVEVTETHVQYKAVQDCNLWYWTDTIEKFRKLESESLKWGAVFEPAPNPSKI
jgi:hypothetical protein